MATPAEPTKDDRLLAIISSAKQRGSDRLIVRTMRLAVKGLGAIAILFVTYIIALLYIGAHDNRRLDDLERRVQVLEAHDHAH